MAENSKFIWNAGDFEIDREELPDDELDDEVLDAVWEALEPAAVKESEFPPLGEFLQWSAELGSAEDAIAEALTLSTEERTRIKDSLK